MAKAGTTVTYQYNLAGQLTTILYNGFSYGFEYNSFGRLTRASVAGRTLITHSYAPNNGNLLKSTYGTGVYIDYAYDSYDRPMKKIWNNTVVSTITYDARGNVYKTTDGFTGITTIYSYDLIGRRLSSESTNGQMQWTEYDTYNRVASSYLSFDFAATVRKITYLYGDGTTNKHKSMIYGISIDNTQKLKYEYDQLCRLSASYVGTNLAYKTAYRYLDNADKSTTALLAGIKNGSSAEITSSSL